MLVHKFAFPLSAALATSVDPFTTSEASSAEAEIQRISSFESICGYPMDSHIFIG